MIIEALKAQESAWYQALQDQTGTPVGRTAAAYWGKDTREARNDGTPSEQEWVDAAPVLFAAALEAGVYHPSATATIPAGTTFTAKTI